MKRPAGIPTLLGHRILLARDALNIQTIQLQRLTGFSSQRLAYLYKAKGPPAMDVADKLCEALQIGHLYLYHGRFTDTPVSIQKAIWKELEEGWRPREPTTRRGRPPKKKMPLPAVLRELEKGQPAWEPSTKRARPPKKRSRRDPDA